MLTVNYRNCGIRADETELHPSSSAHLKLYGSRALAQAFGIERFREGRFIDESVAAGVAH